MTASARPLVMMKKTMLMLMLWVLVTGVSGPAGPAAAAPDTAPVWSWPLRGESGKAYRAPPTPYAAGHRGIDIVAAPGTPVYSPADGVVSFAGPVGGRPVLAIRHANGLTSSFEPVDPTVVAGQSVLRGTPVGVTAVSAGHCPTDCVHVGARVDGRYLSPLALLEGVRRAVLLPLRTEGT